jgi:molybdopterin-guanine dinucleotide biosynthesis protein A
MGTPKAALEWHGSTLLRRTTGIVARGVDGPVVVVRAAGQDLPALPSSVEVLDDPHEGLGPLQGIAVGLDALRDRAETAFICSTDLPFLHVAFVRRVMRAFDGASPDVVLPHARGHRQPLAAGYRTDLAPAVEKLVAERRLRPAFLFDDHNVAVLDDATLLGDPALAAADPELESVVNVNEPAEYEAARARPAPEITVERFGALAANGHRGPRTVRAATLAQAAAAANLTLDRYVIAAVNGDQLMRDGEAPLAAGDTVSFLSADAGG